MTRLVALWLLTAATSALLAQNASEPQGLLRRLYRDGEQSNYVMKGTNDGSSYQVHLTSTTKRSADGRFVEEYSFSDLVFNGKPRPLPTKSRQFRMPISLEGGSAPFSPPDLSQTPGLVGPTLDLMTFYADMFLAMHSGTLCEEGDRFHVPSPAKGSWADGARVVIGEDAVDFEISLATVDESVGVAAVLVRHVPPRRPDIQIPADWMQEPVADTPNNWVQVRRQGELYIAAVGKETFDVELKIRLADGKMLSAAMENPVEKMARECKDAALMDCGEPRLDPTYRSIEMSLIE